MDVDGDEFSYMLKFFRDRNGVVVSICETYLDYINLYNYATGNVDDVSIKEVVNTFIKNRCSTTESLRELLHDINAVLTY